MMKYVVNHGCLMQRNSRTISSPGSNLMKPDEGHSNQWYAYAARRHLGTISNPAAASSASPIGDGPARRNPFRYVPTLLDLASVELVL